MWREFLFHVVVPHVNTNLPDACAYFCQLRGSGFLSSVVGTWVQLGLEKWARPFRIVARSGACGGGAGCSWRWQGCTGWGWSPVRQHGGRGWSDRWETSSRCWGSRGSDAASWVGVSPQGWASSACLMESTTSLCSSTYVGWDTWADRSRRPAALTGPRCPAWWASPPR